MVVSTGSKISKSISIGVTIVVYSEFRLQLRRVHGTKGAERSVVAWSYQADDCIPQIRLFRAAFATVHAA